MQVTVLVENTSHNPNLTGRHGLSLYLETARHRLLFDTGPDALFAENADKLGIDVSEVDACVLSHGHYDHGGGLGTFFRQNAAAPAYLHPAALTRHAANDGARDIGLSPGLADSPRLRRVDGVFSIDEELTLLSNPPGHALIPQIGSPMLKEAGGAYVPDDFDHEQSLIVESGGVRALFAGCAHRGILNIVDMAEELAGRPMDVVFGGFHLTDPTSGVSVDDDFIPELAARLLEKKAVFYTGHCTGQGAFTRLNDMMGERLRSMSTGDKVAL